jgi:hypothetical protein
MLMLLLLLLLPPGPQEDTAMHDVCLLHNI